MYYILGKSHTAISVAVFLKDKNISVQLFASGACPDVRVSDVFVSISPEEVMLNPVPKGFFVLFDEDNMNVKLSLSIRRTYGDDVFIRTIILQDSLSEKISLCIKNFYTINPADIASQRFVDASLVPDDSGGPVKIKWKRNIPKPDTLTKWSLTFIFGTLCLSTIFFKVFLQIRLIDAFYFTTTTMATVGYGDYSLKDASDIVKLFGSLLMIFSVVGTAVIIALVSDTLIRKRREISMGKVSYSGKNHILVIGGGSVGYHVCKKLKALNQNPVMLDKTIDGRYSQQIIELGVPYLIGDAKDERNLVRAGLSKCKSLLCVTQDDLTNLEVGIDARTIRPDLRVVLRVYDQELASNLREMIGIKHTYSMSLIAAETLISDL